jgi:hypothetical protein
MKTLNFLHVSTSTKCAGKRTPFDLITLVMLHVSQLRSVILETCDFAERSRMSHLTVESPHAFAQGRYRVSGYQHLSTETRAVRADAYEETNARKH